MCTSNRLRAALVLSLFVIGPVAIAEDEAPANPAPEKTVAEPLPPVKRLDGEPQSFGVSADGTVLVVAVESGKEKAAVWAFTHDSITGTKLGTVDGWARRLTVAPGGRYVLVESRASGKSEFARTEKIQVMDVESPQDRYRIKIADARGREGTHADILWAYPGEGAHEVDLHGDDEISIWDLSERRIVRRMSIYERHETAHSADGKVVAIQNGYDVSVNDAQTGAPLFELLSKLPGKKKRTAYRLCGLSGDGAFLVVSARDPGADKKSWIEGYRVSDGKRRWKSNTNAPSWGILVGATRVATLVKGRVKMLDVTNGRSKVSENTSKRINFLASGAGGRYFWAATKDGHLVPLR